MTEQSQKHPNSENLNNNDVYKFRLFITGASPNSIRAIANLKAFCETHLNGKYELEIIDVHQQPLIAKSEQVIALPMAVKTSPEPQRRLIGDMSDPEKIFKALNLTANQ